MYICIMFVNIHKNHLDAVYLQLYVCMYDDFLTVVLFHVKYLLNL